VALVIGSPRRRKGLISAPLGKVRKSQFLTAVDFMLHLTVHNSVALGLWLNKWHVPRYSRTILLPCSANHFQESDYIFRSKIITICRYDNRFYLYFIFSFCLLIIFLFLMWLHFRWWWTMENLIESQSLIIAKICQLSMQ